MPIHLSAAIYVGGLIRWVVEEKKKYNSDEDKKSAVEKGILFSSGMIAGEGLIGIMLAVFAVANLDKVLDLSSIYGDNFMAVGNWVGILAFILLLSIMIRFCKNKKTVKKDI